MSERDWFLILKGVVGPAKSQKWYFEIIRQGIFYLTEVRCIFHQNSIQDVHRFTSNLKNMKNTPGFFFDHLNFFLGVFSSSFGHGWLLLISVSIQEAIIKAWGILQLVFSRPSFRVTPTPPNGWCITKSTLKKSTHLGNWAKCKFKINKGTIQWHTSTWNHVCERDSAVMSLAAY